MGNSQRGFIRQLNRKEVTEALHTEAVSWKPPLWENRECHKCVLEWRRLWSSHCLFAGNYLENQLQVPVNSLVKGKQHPYEFPSVFSSFFCVVRHVSVAAWNKGAWLLAHKQQNISHPEQAVVCPAIAHPYLWRFYDLNGRTLHFTFSTGYILLKNNQDLNGCSPQSKWKPLHMKAEGIAKLSAIKCIWRCNLCCGF